MLRLHGRARSNYYNAVKAVMIEKGLEFEEVKEPVPPTSEFLSLSPMAKIPCLVTDKGPLTETTAILDYLEDVYPDVSMRPSDPFQRAKFAEVNKSLELYVERSHLMTYQEWVANFWILFVFVKNKNV